MWGIDTTFLKDKSHFIIFIKQSRVLLRFLSKIFNWEI